MDDAVIALDPREQALKTKIEDLGRAFLKGGYYTRLVMTDDILSVKEIHMRAKEKKDEFFYGIALPASMQDTIDSIVREDKKILLGLIASGPEYLNMVGLEVEQDPVQKAWLVKISSCGMGFFIAKGVHQPREQRQKRVTLNKLEKALTANQNGQSGRRKIVLGRAVV